MLNFCGIVVAILKISILSNGHHVQWRMELADTNFKRGLSKDHPSQIWFNLVQRFQRRFKCDLLPKYAKFT